MLDVFCYSFLPIILIVDFVILGLAIAIAVRQNCGDGCGNSKCGKGKKCKGKDCCIQKVDVFLTRGSQAMNSSAIGFNTFNSNPTSGTLPNNSGTGNVNNTELDNLSINRTHGIPGLHDFQLYSDCRFPENITGEPTGFGALGMEVGNTSPACPINPNLGFVAAFDWIYIASTSNLSHVRMRFTIAPSRKTAAGACQTIRGCIPKLLRVNWYNFYGYARCVKDFKSCGKGVWEFTVPLVVANAFFPVTEITFHYCPTSRLTPGATYRYKVEVLEARCARLINKKKDAVYYAIQDVPLSSPLTFSQAGGAPCDPCPPVCAPCAPCKTGW